MIQLKERRICRKVKKEGSEATGVIILNQQVEKESVRSRNSRKQFKYWEIVENST